MRAIVLLTTAALIAGLVGCQADVVPEYALTLSSSEGGEVTSPGEGSFTYAHGTVVDLVAEADDGHRFVNWSGHTDTMADVHAARTTMVIDNQYEVIANFVAQYQLTILSTGGGEVVTPGEGTFTYDKGTVVSLVATPASGYRFVNWTGDVDTVVDVNAASTSIIMNSNCSVAASFAELLKIWDWYGLHAVRYNMSGSYMLMAHLDSTTVGYQELASPAANDGNAWEPIGALDNRFSGTFDGQGYEIRDVFIRRPDANNVGLFAVIDDQGLVENVGVVNADVTGGTSFAGALVGANRGLVRNSYSGGRVDGTTAVGGLVGLNNGSVCNSHFDGDSSGQSSVGGLVGQNSGSVTSSYSTGSVTGNQDVGGLVGVNWWTRSSVRLSYSESSVSGNWAVGGLVGRNYAEGTVTDSYSGGGVTGISAVGGLVGLSGPGSRVTHSYSSGSVNGEDLVGGLVGENQARVFACFWDTEASGLEHSDGGLGRTTAQMQDIATFAGAGWDIGPVIAGETNGAYIWNIVDGQTYPFLSWQSVS